MKLKLLEALEPFGYDVSLQGTYGEDETLPETFITYWTESTQDDSHYDDSVHGVRWYFSVILYSRSAAIVNTKPKEITQALKSKGFIPQGMGQDIPSDEPDYTGWQMTFLAVDYD